MDILLFRRGQGIGDFVRLQVHRDVGWHKSQCGRVAGRTPVADSIETRKPREIKVNIDNH